MKIVLDFKTPDVVFYALKDFPYDDKRANIEAIIAKFVKGEEAVSIEIDTITEKAIVLER